MKSTTNVILNLQVPNYSVAAYAVQCDEMSRELSATLLDGSTPWTPPAGALGTIRYLKPDGTCGFYDTLEDNTTVAVTWTGNVATIKFAAQVLTVAGEVIVQLSFYSADAERLSCFNFILNVEQNPLTDDQFESTDYYSVLTARIADVLGAVAHAPQINSQNHWVLWDEETQQYYDSGVDATGPQGATGEQGPQGVSITSVTKKSGTGAAGTRDEYNVNLSNSTIAGTFSVYNGNDGQGAPTADMPLPDSGSGVVGTANAYARGDHQHPINVPTSGTPEMDGEASNGSAGTYARSDHVHPTDTSRASQTDLAAVQSAAASKVLYLTSVTVLAATGNIITVSNESITSDHVLVEIVFAQPSYITTNLTWTTASESLTISGTCSTATTADIVLIKKDN